MGKGRVASALCFYILRYIHYVKTFKNLRSSDSTLTTNRTSVSKVVAESFGGETFFMDDFDLAAQH